jgi:hypothetical protein
VGNRYNGSSNKLFSKSGNIFQIFVRNHECEGAYVAWIALSVSTSNDADASSSAIIFVFLSNTLARDSNCLSPLLNKDPSALTTVSSLLGNVSITDFNLALSRAAHILASSNSEVRSRLSRIEVSKSNGSCGMIERDERRRSLETSLVSRLPTASNARESKQILLGAIPTKDGA